MDYAKSGGKSRENEYSYFEKSTVDEWQLTEEIMEIIDTPPSPGRERYFSEGNSNMVHQGNGMKCGRNTQVEDEHFSEEVFKENICTCKKKMKFDLRKNLVTEKCVEEKTLGGVLKKNPTSELQLKNSPPIRSGKNESSKSIFVCLCNVVNIESKFQSPPNYISGIPWRLYVEKKMINVNKKYEEYLSFYVQCCESKKNWKVSANCKLVIFNQETKKPNLMRKISHLFCEEQNYCGYNNFVSMSELTDPRNNYMVENKIFLEVVLNVNKYITDKDINKKVRKYLEVVDDNLKKGELNEAGSICANAIQCLGHLGSSYIEPFKKKLKEITLRQVSQTIERIENVNLKSDAKNDKVLKKESDLKKLCQGNKNNNNKHNSNDSDNNKNGNSDVKNNNQVIKTDNDSLTQENTKNNSTNCDCRYSFPDMTNVCENCRDHYESKTFFYHVDDCKTFYYMVYGPRLYLAKICLGKFFEYKTVHLDSRIVPVEKFFNKNLKFSSTIESLFFNKISYLNASVGKFIINVQKNKNELQKILYNIMAAFKTKADDNITSTIPSIAQDHILGLNVFDNISTIHFGEYPLEVVMECIRLNTRKSINIFDKYSKVNDFQNHNGILDVVRDPNIENIFQNSNSYLCLFPTMWLTIIGQTLDSWIKFYSKCNIRSLTQELLDSKAEINRLEQHTNSLNTILEKKTLLINKLHKKIDLTKKPSEKLIEANNRISKLEEMVAALTEQNKALYSEKENLSDEIRQLKVQCKNFERINNEKENRYKALQRSSKNERTELDQKIKTLKNQCKKSELSLLERMYDMEIESLQKYKNEAIEKLKKWNTLSDDIFNRNSDEVIKNKEIINKYINDISEQINTATNNYKKNITLIEDGKSFSHISKTKPKNIRRCPSTNYDHLIGIQKLETVSYDGISVSPINIYKRKSNLKTTGKNQFNSSYRQDARTSCSSDSQSKVSNVVEDVFSNCGHFDKNEFLVTSNRMEYYSSNNSWVSDDFERRDFNFHDSLSPPYNGTGSIKEANTPRNNVFSPYPDPPRSGFTNTENQFFPQINSVCSLENNTITSNIRTVKSFPNPVQPPNTFPGKHYIQSENEIPYITNPMSPFYKKASDNFSNTISKNNHTPSHLNFNNYLYGNNCLNGQLMTKNQYIPNSTDDNFLRLLKDFSSEQSNNNMW